jgi:DnaJ family protein C protein 17
MKPSKKAPSKPLKHATALVPFTSIGAAFAAVGASGRADRGLDGIEVSWAGGSEPLLIGWLKKKGMLGSEEANSLVKGKSPPLTSASTPSVVDGDSYSSFPESFVSLAPFSCIGRDAEVCGLQLETKSPANVPGVDFESLTLMRMRQTERERLEREILDQEAAAP